MRRQKGFTLIELLIVVAIIGIIAAIAIPSLLRARVSAQESCAAGEMRTVHSALTAYQSSNAGAYDSNLLCMNVPWDAACLGTAGYPTTAPNFLDSILSSSNPKCGYSRSYLGDGDPATGVGISGTSVMTFVYQATPTSVGNTGVRGFGIDHTGLACFTMDGTEPDTVVAASGVGVQLDGANCNVLRF